MAADRVEAGRRPERVEWALRLTLMDTCMYCPAEVEFSVKHQAWAAAGTTDRLHCSVSPDHEHRPAAVRAASPAAGHRERQVRGVRAGRLRRHPHGAALMTSSIRPIAGLIGADADDLLAGLPRASRAPRAAGDAGPGFAYLDAGEPVRHSCEHQASNFTPCGTCGK
jgi:hypothetical protein